MTDQHDAAALARGRLLGVPGAAAARIDDGVVARLPASTPPPPWDTVADAVLWLQRPPRPAASLPAGLPALRLPGPAVAGLIAYRDSPVGAYRELLVALPVLHGGTARLHVPLMAVDSLASLHGGRAHWALPKTLANVTGGTGPATTVRAHGTDWRLQVRGRALGPRVPVRLRVGVVQSGPDGSGRAFAVTVRGHARLAAVRTLTAEPAAFARWLPVGRHLGIALTDARVRVAAPVGG